MSSFDTKKDFSAEFKVSVIFCNESLRHGFHFKNYFAVVLQAIVPQSLAVANEKGIDEAVSLLFALEKKCRLSNDHTNLKEVCLHAVKLCREKNDWTKLNTVLALINKRNSQSKTTIIAVVAEAMSFIDLTPTTDIKIELIKALMEICDGKMFVEGESARLHLMLSKIYEASGDVTKATDMIQDVHVETYGSLSKMEKAEYILEQIRLNLLKKDYIRTAIHSRKMNTKTIAEPGFEAIKIRFYQMMIEFYTAEKDTWEICQAYYKVPLIMQNWSLFSTFN